MSGARTDRPGLQALLDYAREGDTVTVVALDRLGRSLSGVIDTIDQLHARDIALRSLREGIDYSAPVGRMVAAIFAALAEYERTLIDERAASAREAARARGRHVGRPEIDRAAHRSGPHPSGQRTERDRDLRDPEGLPRHPLPSTRHEPEHHRRRVTTASNTTRLHHPDLSAARA